MDVTATTAHGGSMLVEMDVTMSGFARSSTLYVICEIDGIRVSQAKPS
jgi:hypothetical protein